MGGRMGLKITVFDGAKCIGGSKIHLLAEGTGIFLDFGVNYKRWGEYYEEFLKPRPSRGLLDLLILGMVPPIDGIYRRDLFPADLSEEPSLKVQVDAFFVTHSHMDHCGHLGLVDPGIPVYTSTMSAVILKATRDSGRADFDKEVAYITPKYKLEGNPNVLDSYNWNKRPYVGRTFYVVDEENLNPGVNAFWTTPPNPSERGRELEAVPLSPASGRVGNLKFKAFPVDHSVYGATAYAFETSAGWVVYTGDFRLHGRNGGLSLDFVEEAAGLRPLVLITEGTNVGEDIGVKEEEVYENCLRAVEAAEGIVVADFAPRNIERLLTFLEIAKESGRGLVVLAKDAYLLHAMRLVDEGIPDLLSDPNLFIYEELKAKPDAWEKELVRKLYGSKYVPAERIRRNQGDYILSFSFWDVKHLLDVRPKGGIYIYSTSEAYTEEQEIDVRRLWNWLNFFGIRPIGFTFLEGGPSRPKPIFCKGYHSSGHISGEELLEVIREIRPKYLIPVHTEDPEFFVEKLKGEIRVLLPEEGVPLEV